MFRLTCSIPRLCRLEKRLAPATITVNTWLENSSNTSLRKAIADANNNVLFPGADTIVFDPAVFNQARTYELTLGQMTIIDALTIDGPYDRLTINAKDGSRIFNITDSGKGSVNFLDLTLRDGNVAGTEQGGAIYVGTGNVTLTNCDVTSNTAAGSGGAIHLELAGAKLTLTNTDITLNTSTLSVGGGISTDASATIVIQDSYVTSNSAQGRGGAIATASNCSLTVQASIIQSNVSLGSFGGGISAGSGSTVVISDSTVSTNKALSDGGGVAMSGGSLTVLASSIAYNTAPSEGGGIYVSSAATTIIRNSTLSRNSAGYGGGVSFGLKSGGSLTVQNSTIYDNDATSAGGGIQVTKTSTASIAIVSSIVAGNTGTSSGDDINAFGISVSVNFSAIGDGSGFAFSGGNNLPFGTDLKLSPSGYTTVQPYVGSPLRSAGSNPTGLTTDQRGAGYPRQRGSAVDIGAVEVQELVVLNTNDSGLGSLRQATLDAAALGVDTITFEPTAFATMQTITLTTGELFIYESIRITGPANGVTIDGNKASRVLSIWTNSGFSASDLTIVNGKSTLGGGLRIFEGDLALTRVTIRDCTATLYGGGIFFNPPPGGLFTPSSDLSLTDCVLTGNKATGVGGGLYARYAESLYATNCTITSNTASSGGGVCLRDCEVSNFNNVSMNQNMAGTSGGGIYVLNPFSGLVQLSNLTIADNTAGANGGGIYWASSYLTLANVALTGNKVSDGIGVNNGGGLFATAGTFTINTSVIANNETVDRGGGLFFNSNSTVTVTNTTVAGNAANTGGGLAFSNDGTLTVTGSTLSGNTAKATGGGGLYFFGSGNLALRNSTLSGNSAANIGGAVAAYFTGSLTVQNSTITANSAVNAGGGIARGSGTGSINVTSSIVAGNSNAVSPDISSTITVNVNYSAIGSPNGFGLSGTNNRAFGTDLKLGPLADNGGLTKTHALGAGSDAIDHGSNTLPLTTDQRGSVFVRANPTGMPDIGAHEFQSGAKVVAVQVNDGSAQRSRVTSLTVTFDSAVTLPTSMADAFELRRQSDNAVVDLDASMMGNNVTLTFTGGPMDFDSLADGRYTLTAFAAQINSGLFDGNGDGGAGDNYQLIGDTNNKLFRHFGDADGNGTINAADFTSFRSVFATGASLFDFNNDGQTNNADFVPFRTRYGFSI